MKILALDLGKFKSVYVMYVTALMILASSSAVENNTPEALP